MKDYITIVIIKHVRTEKYQKQNSQHLNMSILIEFIDTLPGLIICLCNVEIFRNHMVSKAVLTVTDFFFFLHMYEVWTGSQWWWPWPWYNLLPVDSLADFSRICWHVILWVSLKKTIRNFRLLNALNNISDIIHALFTIATNFSSWGKLLSTSNNDAWLLSYI